MARRKRESAPKPHVDTKSLEQSKKDKEKALEQNEIVKKDENQTANRT